MNFTNIFGDHTNFYIFGNFSGFQKQRNYNPGSNKTKICIDKLPFTLDLFIVVINNSTATKELKNGPVNAFKKASKLVFLLQE